MNVRTSFDTASPETNEMVVDDNGYRYSQEATRSYLYERRLAAQLTPADKIPKPSEWTPESFADYVRQLTSSEGPNHLNRIMYKKGDHVSTDSQYSARDLSEPRMQDFIVTYSLQHGSYNTSSKLIILLMPGCSSFKWR